MAHDHLAPDVGDMGGARLYGAMPTGTKGMHMQGEAMKQQDDRRKTQEPFYDAIVDRREREGPQPVPAAPGMIRPAPGDVVPKVERRRFPDVGME